jgi:hypothetical protein
MEVSGQLHAQGALIPGKCPWYPLDRRKGGPQNRSGHGGEKKSSQPLPGLEPPIIQTVAQRYTTWAITAPESTEENQEKLQSHLLMQPAYDDFPNSPYGRMNFWQVTRKSSQVVNCLYRCWEKALHSHGVSELLMYTNFTWIFFIHFLEFSMVTLQTYEAKGQLTFSAIKVTESFNTSWLVVSTQCFHGDMTSSWNYQQLLWNYNYILIHIISLSEYYATAVIHLCPFYFCRHFLGIVRFSFHSHREG